MTCPPSGPARPHRRCAQTSLPLACPGTFAENGGLKLSIVIPAYNEEQLLGQTLQRLDECRAVLADAGWESEVIVCDNASSDRTAAIAREAGVKVVHEPRRQIARARNRGALEATGDWLVFVDADSRPSAGLFAEVVERIRSGRCLAGGSTVRLEAGYPLASMVAGFWNCISRINRWMAGSFIFCETEAFRSIGGFSEELFVSEEIDLSRRLRALARKRGLKIVILYRHPLHTSARKMRLYSTWDHLRFAFRMALRPAGVVRDREACDIWYDGRR
jgi:glycosyltransferase involved in cell wall biosynthesis